MDVCEDLDLPSLSQQVQVIWLSKVLKNPKVIQRQSGLNEACVNYILKHEEDILNRWRIPTDCSKKEGHDDEVVPNPSRGLEEDIVNLLPLKKQIHIISLSKIIKDIDQLERETGINHNYISYILRHKEEIYNRWRKSFHDVTPKNEREIYECHVIHRILCEWTTRKMRTTKSFVQRHEIETQANVIKEQLNVPKYTIGIDFWNREFNYESCINYIYDPNLSLDTEDILDDISNELHYTTYRKFKNALNKLNVGRQPIRAGISEPPSEAIDSGAMERYVASDDDELTIEDEASAVNIDRTQMEEEGTDIEIAETGNIQSSSNTRDTVKKAEDVVIENEASAVNIDRSQMEEEETDTEKAESRIILSSSNPRDADKEDEEITIEDEEITINIDRTEMEEKETDIEKAETGSIQSSSNTRDTDTEEDILDCCVEEAKDVAEDEPIPSNKLVKQKREEESKVRVDLNLIHLRKQINIISLSEEISDIEELEDETGISQTYISYILRHKEEICNRWRNACHDKTPKFAKEMYECQVIDRILCEWTTRKMRITKTFVEPHEIEMHANVMKEQLNVPKYKIGMDFWNREYNYEPFLYNRYDPNLSLDTEDIIEDIADELQYTTYRKFKDTLIQLKGDGQPIEDGISELLSDAIDSDAMESNAASDNEEITIVDETSTVNIDLSRMEEEEIETGSIQSPLKAYDTDNEEKEILNCSKKYVKDAVEDKSTYSIIKKKYNKEGVDLNLIALKKQVNIIRLSDAIKDLDQLERKCGINQTFISYILQHRKEILDRWRNARYEDRRRYSRKEAYECNAIDRILCEWRTRIMQISKTIVQPYAIEIQADIIKKQLNVPKYEIGLYFWNKEYNYDSSSNYRFYPHLSLDTKAILDDISNELHYATYRKFKDTLNKLNSGKQPIVAEVSELSHDVTASEAIALHSVSNDEDITIVEDTSAVHIDLTQMEEEETECAKAETGNSQSSANSRVNDAEDEEIMNRYQKEVKEAQEDVSKQAADDKSLDLFALPIKKQVNIIWLSKVIKDLDQLKRISGVNHTYISYILRHEKEILNRWRNATGCNKNMETYWNTKETIEFSHIDRILSEWMSRKMTIEKRTIQPYEIEIQANIIKQHLDVPKYSIGIHFWNREHNYKCELNDKYEPKLSLATKDILEDLRYELPAIIYKKFKKSLYKLYRRELLSDATDSEAIECSVVRDEKELNKGDETSTANIDLTQIKEEETDNQVDEEFIKVKPKIEKAETEIDIATSFRTRNKDEKTLEEKVEGCKNSFKEDETNTIVESAEDEVIRQEVIDLLAELNEEIKLDDIAKVSRVITPPITIDGANTTSTSTLTTLDAKEENLQNDTTYSVDELVQKYESYTSLQKCHQKFINEEIPDNDLSDNKKYATDKMYHIDMDNTEIPIKDTPAVPMTERNRNCVSFTKSKKGTATKLGKKSKRNRFQIAKELGNCNDTDDECLQSIETNCDVDETLHSINSNNGLNNITTTTTKDQGDTLNSKVVELKSDYVKSRRNSIEAKANSEILKAVSHKRRKLTSSNQEGRCLESDLRKCLDFNDTLSQSKNMRQSLDDNDTILCLDAASDLEKEDCDIEDNVILLEIVSDEEDDIQLSIPTELNTHANETASEEVTDGNAASPSSLVNVSLNENQMHSFTTDSGNINVIKHEPIDVSVEDTSAVPCVSNLHHFTITELPDPELPQEFINKHADTSKTEILSNQDTFSYLNILTEFLAKQNDMVALRLAERLQMVFLLPKDWDNETVD